MRKKRKEEMKMKDIHIKKEVWKYRKIKMKENQIVDHVGRFSLIAVLRAPSHEYFAPGALDRDLWRLYTQWTRKIVSPINA